MREVLNILGLQVLTGMLLFLASLLSFSIAIDWRNSSGPRKIKLLAVSLLCFAWANYILGASLAPRYLHGSALAPGAGRGPGGAYLVVDQFGQQTEVPETEFSQQRAYEEVSLRLPGYVTPAVGLILLAFWPRGRKRLSDRAMNDDAEPTITAASEGKKGTRTFSVDTKTARRESR